LEEEDKEEYREAFVEFDKNKDGRINDKELQALMRHLGVIMTTAEILEMIREAGGKIRYTYNYQW
jgi:Ca2+-binding EF-hand superfamily protein